MTPPPAGDPATALRAFDVDRVTLARYGLLVLAAAIPLQRATIIGAVGSLVSLIGLVVIPLALWAGWTHGRRRALVLSPLVFAVALAWWAGASYFWSVDPDLTADSFLRLLPIVAMAVAYSLLSTDAAFRLRLLRGYVLGSVAASTMVIGQYLTTPEAARFSVGPEASINQVAFTLVLALIPAAYLLAMALRRRARRRVPAMVLYGASYSAIAAGVLLSGSRSGALLAVLSTLMALGMIVYASPRLSDALQGAAALLALGVAFVWGLSLTESPPFKRLTEQNEIRWQEEARAEILAEAWQRSAERPIVGAGLDTGVTLDVPGYSGLVRNPHNTHMQVFLELGAVGALLWLLLIAAIFRATVTRPPSERLLWVAQLAVLFIGIGTRGFVYGVPMWFFLGVASALAGAGMAGGSDRARTPVNAAGHRITSRGGG